MSYGESLGLFGVSETLDLKVPQYVRTLRVYYLKGQGT